uniref:Uncharacterized protein n=1 Tax=Alexandrium andersonii TaxID=327968 RepID=A0A7S2CIZ5_9DINO|mmetsp:Transcript_39400/g.89569  ORF Transcript_39400/g.89569 Transcript_39400/m.89569 type:complete len:244 (+) Transcript_39400:50-781(+)
MALPCLALLTCLAVRVASALPPHEEPAACDPDGAAGASCVVVGSAMLQKTEPLMAVPHGEVEAKAVLAQMQGSERLALEVSQEQELEAELAVDTWSSVHELDDVVGHVAKKLRLPRGRVYATYCKDLQFAAPLDRLQKWRRMKIAELKAVLAEPSLAQAQSEEEHQLSVDQGHELEVDWASGVYWSLIHALDRLLEKTAKLRGVARAVIYGTYCKDFPWRASMAKQVDWLKQKIAELKAVAQA